MKFSKVIKNTTSNEVFKNVNTTTTTVKQSKKSLDVNIIKDTDVVNINESFCELSEHTKEHVKIKEYDRKDQSEILEIKIENIEDVFDYYIENKKTIRINITKLLQLPKDQLNDLIQFDYYSKYIGNFLNGSTESKHVGKVKSK